MFDFKLFEQQLLEANVPPSKELASRMAAAYDRNKAAGVIPNQAPQRQTKPAVQQQQVKPAVQQQQVKPQAAPTPAPAPVNPRDRFDDDFKERLSSYERAHQGRVKKALGGSPFEDADPESDRYKMAYPRMEKYHKMTPDQQAALGMYGENVHKYYQTLNNRLRTGQRSDDDNENAMYDYMNDNLRSALETLEPKDAGTFKRFTNGKESEEPYSFNRAVSGDFVDKLSELEVGDEIEDGGYGSYTNRGGPALDMFFDKNTPKNAAIRLAPGSKLRDISPVTEYQEGEHLSMPGQRFRVKEVIPDGHYSRKVGNVPLYVLELLDLQDDGKLNNSVKESDLK